MLNIARGVTHFSLVTCAAPSFRHMTLALPAMMCPLCSGRDTTVSVGDQ